MERALGNRVRLKVGLHFGSVSTGDIMDVLREYPQIIKGMEMAQSKEFIQEFEDILQARPDPSIVYIGKSSFLTLYKKLKQKGMDMENGPIFFKYNDRTFSLTMDAICG